MTLTVEFLRELGGKLQKFPPLDSSFPAHERTQQIKEL
jgi:hypothetical protein